MCSAIGTVGDMVQEKRSRECCSSWTVLHAQCTSALSSGFLLSQGNAEAPDRWGGKTKHRLISYFLSNTSAKNYRNWIVRIKVIASQRCDFFATQCSATCVHALLQMLLLEDSSSWSLWPVITCRLSDGSVQALWTCIDAVPGREVWTCVDAVPGGEMMSWECCVFVWGVIACQLHENQIDSAASQLEFLSEFKDNVAINKSPVSQHNTRLSTLPCLPQIYRLFCCWFTAKWPLFS